jgi:hypothetical protein
MAGAARPAISLRRFTAPSFDFARRGLLLLVGVEYRGDALGIGGEGRDAGALDLQ